MILHGLRRWHDKRGQLRQQSHRISRHYYDIYKLIQSEVGQRAKEDHALAVDCARHAQMFFNSIDLDLKSACRGSFAISPTPGMAEVLKRDYQAMTGMIFGEVPDFSNVMNTVRQLEDEINQGKIKPLQIELRRKRSALPMTETELKLIAALANMGLNKRPSHGYKTPAATGTPKKL